MELKDLKYLEYFGQDFMAKVYKGNLSNDSVQKISFLSKLPRNLGDLASKDIELQSKSIDQIYWVDLLFLCQQKVKYLCWQKQAHDITPSANVCRAVFPWTPFKRKRRHKRYGKFKTKKIANPKRPFKNFRFMKKRK